MVIYRLKLFIVFVFIIFLLSCNNNKFNIKLVEEDYDFVYNLIVEINNKAINNDMEYFRSANRYQHYFGTEEERTNYFDFSRMKYQKEGYSDEEIIEYEDLISIKAVMETIVRADIVNTYKKRAYASNNGLHFNYCWHEKDVHFQMNIVKEWEDLISENAFIGGGIQRWVLYSVYNCR